MEEIRNPHKAHKFFVNVQHSVNNNNISFQSKANISQRSTYTDYADGIVKSIRSVTNINITHGIFKGLISTKDNDCCACFTHFHNENAHRVSDIECEKSKNLRILDTKGRKTKQNKIHPEKI